MLTQLEKIPSKKKPKNKWIKQQYRLERKRKQKQQLRYINNGRQVMNDDINDLTYYEFIEKVTSYYNLDALTQVNDYEELNKIIGLVEVKRKE